MPGFSNPVQVLWIMDNTPTRCAYYGLATQFPNYYVGSFNILDLSHGGILPAVARLGTHGEAVSEHVVGDDAGADPSQDLDQDVVGGGELREEIYFGPHRDFEIMFRYGEPAWG
jgi:hypothetical protein